MLLDANLPLKCTPLGLSTMHSCMDDTELTCLTLISISDTPFGMMICSEADTMPSYMSACPYFLATATTTGYKTSFLYSLLKNKSETAYT